LDDDECKPAIFIEIHPLRVGHPRSLYIYVFLQSSHENCAGLNLDYYCGIHNRNVRDVLVLVSPILYDPYNYDAEARWARTTIVVSNYSQDVKRSITITHTLGMKIVRNRSSDENSLFKRPAASSSLLDIVLV